MDKSYDNDFLPDEQGSSISQSGSSKKFQYYVKIRWAKDTGVCWTDGFESYDFFWPPYPGQKDSFLPVRFIPPYFDCGLLEQWIFSKCLPLWMSCPAIRDLFTSENLGLSLFPASTLGLLNMRPSSVV